MIPARSNRRASSAGTTLALTALVSGVLATACSYDPDLSPALSRDGGRQDAAAHDLPAAVEGAAPATGLDAAMDGTEEDPGPEPMTGTGQPSPTDADAAVDLAEDGGADGDAGPDARSPGPVRFAFALANQPNLAAYDAPAEHSFNGSEQPIAVARSAPGTYEVTFAGLPPWGPGVSSGIAVTTHGASPITCAVEGYDALVAGARVKVACFDLASRTRADAPFGVMFVGNGGVPTMGEFHLTGGDAPTLDPKTSWTVGTRPPSVVLKAPNRYELTLGTGNSSPEAGQLVTSANGTRCQLAEASRVLCFDLTGIPTPQRFFFVQVGGRPEKTFAFGRLQMRDRDTRARVLLESKVNIKGPVSSLSASVGRYAMRFGGLRRAAHPLHVQVTPIFSSAIACNVTDIVDAPEGPEAAAGLEVSVECRNSSGHLASSGYEVVVIE